MERLALLEIQLLDKDAQIADLRSQLEEARAEVVRTMGRLQSVTSRAEGASAIAEAEVALQSLKSSAGQRQPATVDQVAALIRQSSQEFNKGNYGGALYLAGQARTLAAASGRVTTEQGGASRANETLFTVPIGFKATGRANVRTGPGTNFPVAFEVEEGMAFTGYAYYEEWIRVSDAQNRSGWVFRTLIAPR